MYYRFSHDIVTWDVYRNVPTAYCVVFFKRWGRLTSQHNFYYKGCDSCNFDSPIVPAIAPSAVRCCTVAPLLCILIVTWRRYDCLVVSGSGGKSPALLLRYSLLLHLPRWMYDCLLKTRNSYHYSCPRCFNRIRYYSQCFRLIFWLFCNWLKIIFWGDFLWKKHSMTLDGGVCILNYSCAVLPKKRKAKRTCVKILKDW